MALFRMLMLALTLSIAGYAPANAEAQTHKGKSHSENVRGSWVGKWAGSGKQAGDQWSIDIEFVTPIEGWINYATIPCGGILYLTDTWDNNAIFREKLTTDVENCIDNGTVTLRMINNAVIHYSWKLDDVTATGSLRRINTLP